MKFKVSIFICNVAESHLWRSVQGDVSSNQTLEHFNYTLPPDSNARQINLVET